MIVLEMFLIVIMFVFALDTDSSFVSVFVWSLVHTVFLVLKVTPCLAHRAWDTWEKRMMSTGKDLDRPNVFKITLISCTVSYTISCFITLFVFWFANLFKS